MSGEEGHGSVAVSTLSRKGRMVRMEPPAQLVDAIKEVTETVLTNPGFFVADDLDGVRDWVRRLFPSVRLEVFEQAFHLVVVDPDVPWGKRRFAVRR